MVDDFEIDAYRKGRQLLALLRGRLVMSYCQDAKNRLSNLLTPQAEVLFLSLAELTFLDSAGLGVMVGLKMLANKNHTRLVLLSPPLRIQDIFRVSKLDTIFEIHAGSDAEVVTVALQQPEFCLWCDNKDDRQIHCNTEADFGIRPPLTPPGFLREGAPDQENKVRQLSDDAVESIRQGDYAKAIENYQQVLAIDPDNLSSLNNLGIVLEKKAEWYPQAVEIWRRVLDLSEHANDDKHSLRARKHLDALGKLTHAS